MRRRVVLAAGCVMGAAAGCASLLGVDDLTYADAGAADASFSDATDARPDIAVDKDAGPGPCTPAGSLMLVDFEQGSTTTGYIGGQLTTVLTTAEIGAKVTLDADGGFESATSATVNGAIGILYANLDPKWFTDKVHVEGDVRVDGIEDDDAGANEADLLGVQFSMLDAGFFTPPTSRAALTAIRGNGEVLLQLRVTGLDGGPTVSLAPATKGRWMHVVLDVAPANTGDFTVILTVNGVATPAPARLRGDAVVNAGWGVDRHTGTGDWHVDVDNACVRR